MQSVKLIVVQISSVVDEDGNRGKEIILEEYKSRVNVGGAPDMGMFRDLIDQVFKNMGQTISVRGPPKIVLRLNDEEYESFGIKFEVNDIFQVSFSDGNIMFKKETV